MFYDVLPLRAIAFQILFLLVAIALEAFVLWKALGKAEKLNRKTCVQYATTVNLLSTWVGWMVFFVAEPWLPEVWRVELMGYIFFDFRNMPPTLVMLCLIAFLATFLIKWQGIEWLELLLGVKKAPQEEAKDAAKFQGKAQDRESFARIPSRPLAVLWANAASFSAITLLILIRMVWGVPT
jgi:hypothetical protein